MTIPFYCLFIAMLLPYLARIPVAIAMHRMGRYDNRNPRDQQTQLTGWGRRALAAHHNSFEILPVFASAVFMAHLTGADPVWSAWLAAIFIVSRVVYIVLYLVDLGTLRSLVWGLGLLSSLTLALLTLFEKGSH